MTRKLRRNLFVECGKTGWTLDASHCSHAYTVGNMHTNTQRKKWLLFLPYISRDVGASHCRCLCFLNAASIAHTDTPLCKEAQKMHTHRSLWDKCLHVCLELKGIWMPHRDWCRAWLDAMNYTHSPCRVATRTHTQAYARAHKRGLRGNVTDKHAVMTLDFPVCLLQQRSFSKGGGSANFTCRRTYKDTHLTSNPFSQLQRKKQRKRGERERERD